MGTMVSTKPGMSSAALTGLKVSAYTIPTDFPESDGTYTWDRTTLVVVEAYAGQTWGLGYTYADVATAILIRTLLTEVVMGRDVMGVPGCWQAMVGAIRNLGRPGVSSMAVAAVDTALWDLKARLLGLPLVTLLGAVQPEVMIYGSGGFISYSEEQLQKQLRGWAEQNIKRVKVKIGRDAQDDIRRVRAARAAIGDEVALFVDANGAYNRKQALAMATFFEEEGVIWFEEPVSSDDLAGLRLIRDRAPAGMEIAAGEYGYDLAYFRRMLEAGAIDVLQADVTRCSGITGFLRVGALCQAYGLPFSAHCAPALHVHPACALPNIRHLEYFHDHVRIEQMAFDGTLTPHEGLLTPDLSRPGLGLTLRRTDLGKYAVER